MCHDSAHNAAGDGRRASASTISSAGRERFTGRHSRCEFTSRRPCAPRPSIVPPVLLLTATSCTAPDPSPFMQCWCRAIAGRQRRFVCDARVSYQYVWLLFGRCAVMVPDGSVHGGGRQGSLQVERHPQPSPPCGDVDRRRWCAAQRDPARSSSRPRAVLCGVERPVRAALR